MHVHVLNHSCTTRFDVICFTLGRPIRTTLATKQLLENVFKTFQNGWILVEMLSFLLVVFRFFPMEFQLVFIHENQQLKTKKWLQISMVGPVLLGLFADALSIWLCK